MAPPAAAGCFWSISGSDGHRSDSRAAGAGDWTTAGTAPIRVRRTTAASSGCLAKLGWLCPVNWIR